MRLRTKTALITGGNSGIGLATARLFLAEGARVAITGRNQKSLDAAASDLGSGLLAIQADVTDIEATEGVSRHSREQGVALRGRHRHVRNRELLFLGGRDDAAQ